MKKCSRCKKYLLLDAFQYHKFVFKKKGYIWWGYRSICENCRREEWREKRVAFGREHRAYKRAYHSQWREQNREKVSGKSREWREKNKEKDREMRLRGKYKRRGATIGMFSEEEFKKKWIQMNGACGICGEFVDYSEVSRDHIIPISRGGTNEISNIQPTHAICNNKKWAKLPGEANGVAAYRATRGLV